MKKYLGAVKNKVEITPELLDKLKNLADAAKEAAEASGKPLSRFNAKDVEDALERIRQGDESLGKRKQSENNTGQEQSPGGGQHDVEPDARNEKIRSKTNQLAYNTFEEFGRQYTSIRNAHLGGRYLKPEYFDFKNESFEDLNFLLAALQRFGVNEGDESERLSRNAILSPSIRSFYELSLLVLRNNRLIDQTVGISSNHNRNVREIAERMEKDDKFIQYLSDRYPGAFTGYKQAKSIISSGDFEKSIKVSQLTAHSSNSSVTEEQVRAAFESAVLFSLLTQAYVTFKS